MRAALVILAAFTVLRTLCAVLVPLLQSESYYWLWSRELAWGYFDHPPGVAVAMLGSGPLGDGTLALRAGHIALGTLSSFVCFLLYRRLVSERAALASLLALSFAPFWFPFGVVATPEGPLLFFWSLALLLFHHASERESLPMSLAAGVALGLGLLSKYNAGLLCVSFLVFLCVDPRRPLRRPHPFVAMGAALLVLAPNLWWNAQHGGTSIGMPFRDGLEPLGAPKHLALLALMPFALLTPLLAWAWLRQTVDGLRSGRFWSDAPFRLAFCASWLPLAAFAVVALVTEIHLQWIVPCFVTALPVALENLGRTRAGVTPRFLRTALISGAVLVGLLPVVVLPILALARHEGPEKPEGLARLAVETRGWDELAARMDSEIEEHAADRPVFLTAPNYHLAAHLEWLAGGRYSAQPLDRRRSKQFLVWERDRDLVGWDALYVHKRHRQKEDDLLRRSCDEVVELDPMFVDLGSPVRRFVLYWCRGFKGLQ